MTIAVGVGSVHGEETEGRERRCTSLPPPTDCIKCCPVNWIATAAAVDKVIVTAVANKWGRANAATVRANAEALGRSCATEDHTCHRPPLVILAHCCRRMRGRASCCQAELHGVLASCY